MAKQSDKETAISAVMKATGHSREKVISDNPLLGDDAPEAAARPPRGRGSNAVSSDPFGPRIR